MNENTPASSTTADDDTATAMSPAEGLEALILLSYRFASDVAASTEFAGRSLSLDAFACLVAFGSDAASSASKIGKRAAAGASLKRGRSELVEAGLIAKNASEGASRSSYVLTDKGKEMLTTVRASLTKLGEGVAPRSLKSVPRIASMTRVIGKKLVLAEVGEAKPAKVKKERPVKAPKERRTKAA